MLGRAVRQVRAIVVLEVHREAIEEPRQLATDLRRVGEDDVSSAFPGPLEDALQPHADRRRRVDNPLAAAPCDASVRHRMPPSSRMTRSGLPSRTSTRVPRALLVTRTSAA